MPVRWVIFDAGETLIDETPHYQRWADWLGVPRDRFMAALIATIAAGEHHHRAFEAVLSGIDLAAETAKRRAAGDEPGFRIEDLHADAVPCLSALRAAGYRIGLCGNTPAATEVFLARAGVPADFIASSATLGAEKPAVEFYQRLLARAGCGAHEAVYVGDRLDNDIAAARAAGLQAIHVRRGLWALHQRLPPLNPPPLTITDLAALPALLRTLEAGTMG